MHEGITHRTTRMMMAFVLAFTLCSYPFIHAKKAEAIAPAVGAAAAAAALAGELGITTEALMTGLMVITAAGTGVYLLESSDYATSGTVLDGSSFGNLWTNPNISNPGYTSNWDSDYQSYKLGNGKSWDELTNEEKANWANPAEYVQSQWLGYLLQTGLIEEVSGGGGFEPTPEPDSGQDPEGNSNWHKARNVLTVLGVTGGAVALNEAVGWLGSLVGNGIHDLLFSDQGFGFPNFRSVRLPEGTVKFAYWSGTTFSGVTIDYDKWFLRQINATGDFKDVYYAASDNSVPTIAFTENNVNGYTASVPRYKKYINVNPLRSGNDNYSWTSKLLNVSNQETMLNAAYSGTYTFTGGYTYSNGELNGLGIVPDYPVIDGTPEEINNIVLNDNDWNNYINNKSVINSNGEIPAVVVPDVLTNGITYQDIVKDTPVVDVTPIPDDEAVEKPKPKPEPGQSGNAPEGFKDDLDDTVDRLTDLKNPLDQVFPFCLIADLRDLTFILVGGEYAQRTTRLQPNELSVQSDVPLDELNGIHNLHIDFTMFFEGFEFDVPLDPVHDVLRYVRFTLTCFTIMCVVIFSFSFFLKRGGE